MIDDEAGEEKQGTLEVAAPRRRRRARFTMTVSFEGPLNLAPAVTTAVMGALESTPAKVTAVNVIRLEGGEDDED